LSTEVGTRRIVTEEGITNLLLCRDKDGREQAIPAPPATPTSAATGMRRWSTACESEA
jgi:hypothetical protein